MKNIMKYIINAKVVSGPMEYRTSEYDTVALARTHEDAVEIASHLASQHPNWHVCCFNTKTWEEVIF